MNQRRCFSCLFSPTHNAFGEQTNIFHRAPTHPHDAVQKKVHAKPNVNFLLRIMSHAFLCQNSHTFANRALYIQGTPLHANPRTRCLLFSHRFLHLATGWLLIFIYNASFFDLVWSLEFNYHAPFLLMHHNTFILCEKSPTVFTHDGWGGHFIQACTQANDGSRLTSTFLLLLSTHTAFGGKKNYHAPTHGVKSVHVNKTSIFCCASHITHTR